MAETLEQESLLPTQPRPNSPETACETLVRPPTPIESIQQVDCSTQVQPQEHLDEYGPSSTTSTTTYLEPENDVSAESIEELPLRKSRVHEAFDWLLEIASLLIAVAAFIALIVILKMVDDQPLSSWIFPFSVNTVVSTLSITMKAPLAYAVGSCLGQGKWTWFKKRPGPLSGFVIFDDASRGPLGCISLLWWLKSRYVSYLSIVHEMMPRI